MSTRVSIVLNSFREDKRILSEAIEGCLSQRDVDVQLIVSTVKDDSAIKIAKYYGADCVISPRPGIYRQINNALKYVKGDWFFYFSGNDICLPNKAISEITACGKDKAVCYSDFYYSDEQGAITKQTKFHPYDRSKHLKGNFVSDVALVRRDVFDKYKPFKEEFGNYAYWDFWLRISKSNPTLFVYNPKPVWVYRVARTSRHVRKINDSGLRMLDNRDRKKMLRSHGVEG